MSKQDRQGARTPADIERKYNLGAMGEQNKQQSEQLNKLFQSFAQFESDTKAKISELEEKYTSAYTVGSIYISVNNTPPSFGEWELLAEGQLVVGLNQETEEEPNELLQLNGTCYLWKRTK